MIISAWMGQFQRPRWQRLQGIYIALHYILYLIIGAAHIAGSNSPGSPESTSHESIQLLMDATESPDSPLFGSMSDSELDRERLPPKKPVTPRVHGRDDWLYEYTDEVDVTVDFLYQPRSILLLMLLFGGLLVYSFYDAESPVANTKSFEFDPILASGRAFKWAQPLCGLDFPNSVVKANSRWYADSTNETDFIMKPYFSKLCELLRKRYRALRSLGSQFQNLIGYKPKLMVDSPNPNHVVKVNQIIDKSDGRYSRQAANVLPNSNVIKDLAMVLDVPGFTVNVEILVHLGYPDVVPTFTFVHDGKNLMGVDADTVAQHYKEIERAVCQQPRELVKRFSTTASGINPAMLLTYQVIKSVACTDIFMTAVRAGDDETLDAALPDYETAI
ncbi:hypothetical protein SeMB42_g02597 [Synchytrium endobioticum]|uniref:Uncharacterized protein n=1 Tax=Synchytrium endobioticum TaxID=286115 RepID=A0A507DD39_9FUNG|nr:hypothetical protein SeMB42_g02597 [Synchytrium endobioticum]